LIKEKLPSKEMVCLLKTSRNRQLLFAVVTHLDDGRSLEALRTLEVEKSLIYLEYTRRPAVSIIEQHLILSLERPTKNKT
jgi:hypothetical protein